ncbi:MAG: SurA N-terminal domain-containing protein [Bacteroidota bacterium]
MNTKYAMHVYGILSYLFLASVAKATSSSVMVDSIIARVEDQLILQSELEAAYQQYCAQANGQAPGLKEKILKQMIANKIMSVCARQENVKVTERELDDEAERRIQYMLTQAGSKERLEQHFSKPLSQIQVALREQLQEQLLLEKLQHKITSTITVTPAEVKEFFDDYPKDELPYYPAQVIVKQIIKYSQTPDELVAAQTTLHQLRQSILEGRITFLKAVQEASEDPQATANEGLLTDADGHTRIAESRLPYDVYMAVESLSPGNISAPTTFTTESGRQGVRILLLQERMEAHQACLEQDYAALQQIALQAKQQHALQQWLQDAQQKIIITVTDAYKHCAPSHSPGS